VRRPVRSQPEFVQSDLFRGSGCNVTDFDERVPALQLLFEEQGEWGDVPPIEAAIMEVDQEDIDTFLEYQDGGYEHELDWSRPLTQADLGVEYASIQDGHHRAWAARGAGIEILASWWEEAPDEPEQNPSMDEHADELAFFSRQAQGLLESSIQLNAARQPDLAYNYAVEAEHMAVLALHQASYFRGRAISAPMADNLTAISEAMVDLAQRAQVERIVATRALPLGPPPGGALPNPMSTSEALSELGLKPGATASEVKTAYRTLAGQRHPDRGGDLEAMKRLNEAREVLIQYGTSASSGRTRSEERARAQRAERGASRYAEYKRKNAPPPTGRYDLDDLIAFAAEIVRMGRVQSKTREKVKLIPFDAFFDKATGHYSRPFGRVVRTRKLKGDQVVPKVLGEAIYFSMGEPGLHARIFDVHHGPQDSWVIFQTLPNEANRDPGFEYVTVSFEEPKKRAPRKKPKDKTTRATVEAKLRELGFTDVAGGSKYAYWAPRGTRGKEGYFVRLAAKSARVVLRSRQDRGFYDMGIDDEPTYYGSATAAKVAAMAKLVEDSRARIGNPTPHRFRYLTDCINIEGIFGHPAGGQIIHYITQHPEERQVSYGQFARQVDLRPLRDAGHPAMYRLSAKDNWSVSFHRSQLPSGQPIYYFAWSRIEHIFVDQEVDVAAELAALAEWRDATDNPPRGTRDKFRRILKESGTFGAYWSLQAWFFYEGLDPEARWLQEVVPGKVAASGQYWDSVALDLIRGRLYAHTTPTSSSPADKYLPWVGAQAKRIAKTLKRLWPDIDNPFAAMIAFVDSEREGNFTREQWMDLAARYEFLGEITENFYPFVSMIRSEGMDVGQQDLFTAKENLEDYKREQAESGLGDRPVIPGTTVYEWGDGWSVQRLDTEAQLKSEGKSMDHCVGGYGGRLNRDYHIYSLRKGDRPAATIEWKFNYRWPTADPPPTPPRGRMIQVQGVSNSDLELDVLERVAEFRRDYFPGQGPSDPFAWWMNQTAGSMLGHEGGPFVGDDDLVRQLLQANRDVLDSGGPGVTAKSLLG